MVVFAVFFLGGIVVENRGGFFDVFENGMAVCVGRVGSNFAGGGAGRLKIKL